MEKEEEFLTLSLFPRVPPLLPANANNVASKKRASFAQG